jgi:hypothetical protein
MKNTRKLLPLVEFKYQRWTVPVARRNPAQNGRSHQTPSSCGKRRPDHVIDRRTAAHCRAFFAGTRASVIGRIIRLESSVSQFPA